MSAFGGSRLTRRKPVEAAGVGRGGRRMRGAWPNAAMIGQAGSLNDGATTATGERGIIRCAACGREYETGAMLERPGRRCIVDRARLFPGLDRE